MFKSTGKILYAPKTHLSSSHNWAILSCDDEISNYYRHLFYKEFPYKGKLNRPVWGAHISFLRKEYVPNYNLWKLDDNKIVEFEYEGGVQSNMEYFWLKVSCPFLENLREKLGLAREPKFGLHLTIGRTTHND